MVLFDKFKNQENMHYEIILRNRNVMRIIICDIIM
jgi:hypothetical protein